jgi:hypothetical protein
LRLAKDFTPQRLERAAARALELKSCSYRALRALITAGQHDVPDDTSVPTLTHVNVRGQSYFQ